MRHIKLLFTIVFTALCVTLFLSGCDGGSNDTNINSDISRFSGTYSGTFTGDDIGSFTFNVDNRGGITGSGISNAVGSFNATGLVEDNGDIDFGIATTSAVFNGKISESGAISGEWINGAASGFFSGSRQ
jgi:hypothetical protein